MKALVSQAYGPLTELAVTDLPVPDVTEGTILVRVEAAGLNGADTKLPTGALRALTSVRHPFVPGMDAAGIVESVGAGVTRVAPGDPVVLSNGFASGAIAEFMLVPDSPSIAVRPDGLDARRGAALPLGALTALTAVEEAGIAAGERVLVVGAAGGVGSFAVQLAKQSGAQVLATGRAEDSGFLTGLGADRTIDYGTADYGSLGVDVLIDLASAGPALEASAAAVRPGGRIISVLGGPESFDRGISVRYIQTYTPEGRLRSLAEEAAAGRLTVPIGAECAFADARQALIDFAERHIRGKVVISL
ncbi:MAG TPA: NADP-dependent oxidoreductase [Mycobacteriales bacterium]|nr:NADP-dependent oxidoreductase [Mycobacteriales bacterium]